VSEKELANRKKFAAAQSWPAPVLEFVRVGFGGYSQRSQGFVAAKSWLLKNAFVSDGEKLRVNPALVKVSSGNLPNPTEISVRWTETRNLKFTWDTTNDGSGFCDQIMMLAYDVEMPFARFNTTGQFRSTGEDILSIDPSHGKNFQVYAAFNAADRSRQSDSIYLGEWKI
jgi:Family of unknown function (DUF6266)